MAKTLDRIFEATAASRELEALIASTAETGGDITELETKIDELAQKAETLPQAIDDLLSLVSEIEYRMPLLSADVVGTEESSRVVNLLETY